MTNIIIPMAGEGKRFSEKGYLTSKPAIPTYDRRTGELLPMVVCAVKDLPFSTTDGGNIIFIDRESHKATGAENEIKRYFPNASFITLSEMTEGQACTCLLAEKVIDMTQPLLIAGCDSGMIFNEFEFQKLTESSDVIAFTFKNDDRVLQNPHAYGWIIADENNVIKKVSVKKPVSDFPMNDHAITATFWFKSADIFLKSAKKMIEANDRINNEFYVDSVLKYTIDLNYVTKVFRIDKYLGWGTPDEYELYQDTIKYWRNFIQSEYYLGEC